MIPYGKCILYRSWQHCLSIIQLLFTVGMSDIGVKVFEKGVKNIFWLFCMWCLLWRTAIEIWTITSTFNIWHPWWVWLKQAYCAGCRRRPYPAEAPPLGKIHLFSKIAVTSEPLMGFWWPSGLLIIYEKIGCHIIWPGIRVSEKRVGNSDCPLSVQLVATVNVS